MEDLEQRIPNERTDVEFLILGDFAEVINGKLYLMGGGWSRFAPASYPATMQFAIAAGVRVPWLESNEPHHLVIEMQAADGQVVFRVEGEVETGRPPRSRGEAMLVPFAMSSSLPLQAPGDFVVVSSVDGREARRVSFRAVER